MPLFFIISGFCWNPTNNASITFCDFAKKKFSRYIIPYLKVCIICFILFTLVIGVLNYGISPEWGKDILKKAFAILVYSRGTTEWLPNCSPVWFLTCLFSAELLLYHIMKQKRPYIYIIISGTIGYFMSTIGKFFPWNIDSALSAIPLIYVGILYKKNWEILSRPKYLFILLPLAIFIELYGVKGVDFDGNKFSNMFAMYLQSSIICLAVLSLCQIVFNKRYKFLSTFGQETIILFGYNYAINTLVLFFFSSVAGTWHMSVAVIVVGCFLVICANRFQRIKRILV